MMMDTLNTMPGFPARVRWIPGPGTVVENTLKRMARNKATGLDEWRVYEMRAWPPHLHNAAAALLEDVERTGVWPAELGGPLGILLEKGGTTDPMDRRPIWLMPMLYRVWASRRSRDWAQWRLGWEGETEFRGADTRAWDVALAMEAAAANGDEFGLLALDWRKAYDGIGLRTLGGGHFREGKNAELGTLTTNGHVQTGPDNTSRDRHRRGVDTHLWGCGWVWNRSFRTSGLHQTLGYNGG